jgi:hypothetical protein
MRDFFWRIKNIARWIPIIWQDNDFDWTALTRVMRFKMGHLAETMQNGHLVGGPRYARQVRVCIHLLNRMEDNDYYNNPNIGIKGWHEAFMRDQKLLGRLIGKYLSCWWD